MTRADREAAALKVGTRVREPAATIATPVTTTGAAATTIRITYVRLAGRYRIDEVTGDGVVREEISPAVFDEAFAEHLAALVADFRQLEVSRGVIDDDGVVLEWERCLRCEKRACLKATFAGRCLDHDVPDHVFSDMPPSVRRGSRGRRAA